MTKLLKISSMTGMLSLTILNVLGQNCVSEFSNFQVSNANKRINWDQFGDIQLPFTLIYGGPAGGVDSRAPLRHGFTHLSDYNTFNLIDPSQRALLYYGVAYPNQNQPLELYRSPWGNNLSIYEQKWTADHANFASGLIEKSGKVEVDIMMFDIERQWRLNFDILQLKSNEAISSVYRNLSDQQFLTTYKKDLRDIYAKPLRYFKNLGYGPSTKVSSYSDSPIWNTFDNIQGFTWQEWKESQAPLNYLLQNDQGEVGGDFENELDFFAPSAYYYYDYPHPFAGEYLSYLLFQIEANRARSSKPIIPFVWLRYSFNPAFQNSFIKPWMAEATAIFPFFSGANGLWLWESPTNFQNDENLATYEYFLKGLKRLSAYNFMFEGDYELVIAESARELNETKKPIWRGVFKEDKLLVAAHNPFAQNENEIVKVPITYRNYTTEIELKGYENKLCLLDLSLLGLEEQDLQVLQMFPNPSTGALSVRFRSATTQPVTIEIIDDLGKKIAKYNFESIIGENEYLLDLNDISDFKVNLRLLQGEQVLTRKLILTK